MTPRNLLVSILAVLTTLPLFGTVASATTIEIIQTFDFPGGEGASTLPQKISDQIDLIGTTISVDGTAQAFIYKVRKQKFSDAFSAPDDTGGITQGRGIDNKRHSCGEYLNGSDGTFHGYLVHHPTVIKVDVTGALDTIPLGINNFGDLAGSAIFSDGTQLGFVNIHAGVTTFAVPDATATFAYQLNSADEVIGYYVDANGIAHGYTRDSAGNLAYPIDVAGATETRLFGNNDSNWGVGRYTDALGVTHGLFYLTPDDIMTYDFPGATYTSLNGINKDGLICGYYGDETGIFHGFVLRVNTQAAGRPNVNMPGKSVKPVRPLPEMSRSGAPVL